MVVKELIDAYERGELDIAPWYQRRAVWSVAHKAYLINSVFESMPVPTVYIRHRIDLDTEKTVKEVVDGQQRIRSILEYRDGDFSARHPHHDRRVKYRDLTRKQREGFLMTSVPVGFLLGASDADVIEIFGRLNAVSKTLNPQEKRSAAYSGEFHQFCIRQAAELLPVWRDYGIFTATQISRMAEVQFVAELSMAVTEGLADYSSKNVDQAYKQWDNDFPQRRDVGKRLQRCFKLVAALDPATVKDTLFSRHPVFFSLVIALDSLKRLPTKRQLTDAIWEIDARFNDDRPVRERPAKDVAFVAACTSSTQRIKSRRTRHDYIASFLNQ